MHPWRRSYLKRIARKALDLKRIGRIEEAKIKEREAREVDSHIKEQLEKK